MVDANSPISWTNFSRENERIVKMREDIADALVQQCIDNGLTVATARDVLERAGKKLDRMVNGFPVAGLCARPNSETDERKP